MKGKLDMRKHVAMLIAIILVVSLVACGEEQASSTSLGSNASTQQEAVVAEPESAVEEPVEAVTEEPAVEESAEEVVEEPVVEEPAVESNPNIIDGFDFTSMNVEHKNMWYNFSRISSDHLMWVCIRNGIVIDVLYEGDLYNFVFDQDYNELFLALYPPKAIVELETNYDSIYDAGDRGINDEIGYRDIYFLQIWLKDSPNLENEEITCTAIYEDGTTEDITVYLTVH